MAIEVKSKKTYTAGELERIREIAKEPLDKLFAEPWMLNSAMGRDRSMAESLKPYVEEIRESADLVLVISEGEAFSLLKAVFDAAGEPEGENPEVVLFGPTLDPEEYSGLIERLGKGKGIIIAVSLGEEDESFKAAYTAFKKMVFRGRPGGDSPSGKDVERVYAIFNSGSAFLAEDARENNYPSILLGEEADPRLLGNEAALLLPMMVAGFDIKEYLMGFSETVASPDWDRDAMLPAWEMAEYLKSAGNMAAVDFITSMKRFLPLTGWCRNYLMRRGFTSVKAGNILEKGEGDLGILITSSEGAEDVMLPFFQGCDPDGSLFSLMKTVEGRAFYECGDPGFGLEAERGDVKNAGALMAFLQMTMALAEELA